MLEVMPARAEAQRRDGVVIARLVGFTEAGLPLVRAPGDQEERLARATVALVAADLGGEVALLFEEGDPERPLVIGRIVAPAPVVEVQQDGRRLELRADQEIVLRCGKASITLTSAGKVLIRGAYVLSRSSGVNKIKGGSVQLN